MRPTKRFWWLVALGVPVAAVTAAAGSPWTVAIYDVLLVCAAYATTLLAPKTDGLRILRRLDSVLSVRTTNRIALELENDGTQTVTGVIRDEPPPLFDSTESEFRVVLEPGRLREVAYSVTPKDRGSVAFQGTFLRQDCPLGLATRDVSFQTEQPVRVYPNVLALREFDLLNQQGRLREIGIRRSRTRGLGSEFESLREYAEGDDYRKIDWKASARRGKPVVRQYEQERNQAVILCIDIGRTMLSEVDGVTKLDHVLDAMLMLTHAAAASCDTVGLLVYSERVRRYIPPRKGRSQVGIIIEAVHDLIAEPVESDPVGAFAYLSARWTRRALLVHFTNFEDPDRARDLVQAFGPMARKHIALLVRVQDPKLKELLVGAIQDRRALYRRAAATMLSEDLVTARGALSAAGIRLLESEPQDLAGDLVSYYMIVKERNLL